MAVHDDSWDVYDYCNKHGLDYDRYSHREHARTNMYKDLAFERRQEEDNLFKELMQKK